MNRLALLFGVAMLALGSCTKDDDTGAPLLRILTVGDYTTTISYNGNKVVSATSDYGNSTYTYTGDFVTKNEVISSNGSSTRTEYIYEVGRLMSEVSSSEGMNSLPSSFKVEYTYNPEGTVTAQNFRDDHDGSGPKAIGSVIYTIVNGNLVKQEDFGTDGISKGMTVYEYDNKNNPYYNIKGFDKLFDATYSKNNITKSTITTSDSSGTPASTQMTTKVCVYNDKGYPLTIQSTYIGHNSPDGPKISNIKYGY